MKLNLYKELFENFVEVEDKGGQLDADCSDKDSNFRKVGSIDFELKPPLVKEAVTESIPFFIDFGVVAQRSQHAYLVTWSDDTNGIVFSRELYVNSDLNRLNAVIAHEMGHYICGHHTSPGYGRQLDINTDRLIKLSRLAGATDATEKDRLKYLRAVMFNLLRGGVIERELEADLTASFFVPIDDLILIHTEDLDHFSPSAMLEKKNRIVKLNSYKDREVSEKFNFKLTLNKPKAKKVVINALPEEATT